MHLFYTHYYLWCLLPQCNKCSSSSDAWPHGIEKIRLQQAAKINKLQQAATWIVVAAVEAVVAVVAFDLLC